MRPCQNLPLPPRIYPLFHNYNIMRPSQNLPLRPRIYPPFQQLYATFQESTPPSQNIPPFSTNAHVRPSQNQPPVPDYTLLFNNYMRPSQNLPVPPRIYPPPPFQQLYATLPEFTPPSQTIPSFSTTICDPLRIYLTYPESTLFFNNYMRPSQNLPLPP